MKVEISDHLLLQANVTAQSLREYIALLFYKRGVFSMGQAASFLDIHRMEFQRLLAERGTWINFTTEDLDDELEILNTLDF